MISVLICALNEEHAIPWVLKRIPPGIDEVVLVDGRSTDRTVEAAKAERPDIKVCLQPDKGKGDALRVGFGKVTGDLVVTIDADGQNDPKELMTLAAPILNGECDLAKGSRFAHGLPTGMPWFRVFGNWVLATTMNVLYGTRFTDVCSGFNALPRRTLELIRFQDLGRFDYELVLYCRALRRGLRVVEVGNSDKGRVAGKSKMPTWHTGWNNFKIIVRERFRRYPADFWTTPVVSIERDAVDIGG